MILNSLRRRLQANCAAFVRDRSGATAVIVALTLPTMVIAMGVAVETSLLKLRESQMQGLADAAAGAAREKYDPFTAGYQDAPVSEAQRITALNNGSAHVASSDVVQGWWDITSAVPDKFGPPIAGQVEGHYFSNAIRVTAHYDYNVALGALIGASTVKLAKTGTGYKCSNLDYPLTLIQDDVPSPSLPAIYMSWATPGHGSDTSYYYLQPDGSRNPIFKFYSPYDGQDVSFVLTMSTGQKLQVDTYCAGTYLVSPAAFDARSYPAVVTATVQRGSTNNSFDVYPDQSKYPFAIAPTPYNTTKAIPTPQYDLSKVKTTPYPSSSGIQYWASQGNPTPDRRSLIVY